MFPAPAEDGSARARARGVRAVLAVVLLLAAGPAAADVEVTTPDGRRVLLRDDQTWAYVDDVAPAPPATMPLEVVSMSGTGALCVLGLELTNVLPYEVKSLVPQFTAVTRSGVDYQTVFQSFNNVMPTRSQYQEVAFRGIDCAAIAAVRVHGGDRCTMGELTKFSRDKGRCLAHLEPVPSDLVTFTK